MFGQKNTRLTKQRESKKNSTLNIEPKYQLHQDSKQNQSGFKITRSDQKSLGVAALAHNGKLCDCEIAKS